jgi:iron complex transport system substrate-binding protein
MRRGVRAALLAGTFIAALGAGAGAAPLILKDTLGRTVQLAQAPRRIVLAGRATLLLVDAVYLFPGASSRIVAVGATDQGLGDFFPFLDQFAGAKLRLANAAGPEQVAAARPDLVILKSFMKEKLGDPLESVGIPVLYLDLESPQTFYADVQTLGDLFQQPERAAYVIQWYRSRVDAVTRAVASAQRPSALIVQYNGDSSFMVPPASWIQTTMTETAGASAAWKETGPGDGWKKAGLEQLSAWNPLYVFVVSYQKPASAIADQVRMAGILKGSILGFPSDFHSWDQADSRWILGLEWLARTIHPDLFAGLDLRSEVLSFYGQLYGLDETTIRTQVLPRLEGALGGR